MKIKEKKLVKFAHLQRYNEEYQYQTNLLSATMFPYMHLQTQVNYRELQLNFSFKDIEFNKKRALAFFMGLELLTNQKCVATLSAKNVLAWKLRKGSLVGCKVTIRKKAIAEFLDSFSLALLRMESVKPITFTKNKKIKEKKELQIHKTYSLDDIVSFYPIEFGLGINTEVRKGDLRITFNTADTLQQIFLLTNSRLLVA